MKNRRERAKQVRQRKVAKLAAYSRNNTVKNCTIPKVDEENLIDKKVSWGIVKAVKGEAEWNIPKKGFKQVKILRKRYKKKYWYKDGTLRKIVNYPSEFFGNHTIPKMPHAKYWEKLAQHKLARWERKNPCPVNENSNPPDIFEKEFITPWKNARDLALERFRDAIVSMYDKLHIVGNRVNTKDGKLVGKTVAKIKDIDQKGHDVNYPNLKESDKLYKDATKAATIAMNKDSTIVDCDLQNHKRTQKRPLVNAKRSKTLKDVKKLKKAA